MTAPQFDMAYYSIMGAFFLGAGLFECGHRFALLTGVHCGRRHHAALVQACTAETVKRQIRKTAHYETFVVPGESKVGITLRSFRPWLAALRTDGTGCALHHWRNTLLTPWYPKNREPGYLVEMSGIVRASNGYAGCETVAIYPNGVKAARVWVPERHDANRRHRLKATIGGKVRGLLQPPAFMLGSMLGKRIDTPETPAIAAPLAECLSAIGGKAARMPGRHCRGSGRNPCGDCGGGGAEATRKTES